MAQQSPSPADSLAAIATLTDEITLHQVYLVSLNDSSGDQSSRKAEIEAEIAILKKELSSLRASSSHAQASSTSHNNSYIRPSNIARSKMNSAVGRGSNAAYQCQSYPGSFPLDTRLRKLDLLRFLVRLRNFFC